MPTITRFLMVLFESERVTLRLVLGAIALRNIRLIVTFVLSRGRREKPVRMEEETLPRVTVQLPLRNEFYVADRVIRAVSQFDYPKDRFEIQVLDDSDDETSAVIDAVVDEVRASTGAELSIVRRSNRDGYKAGHLALGLKSARGEFVAVFDADFIPPVDFLRRTIPLLVRDEKIGMIQGSWDFINRRASFLTRVQAMLLYGLMQIEQPTKSARREPFQFNGTAGVWRRACIEDAGGWSGDSVVEDLDLSFRAIMKGWRFVHLSELAVPTELPETMMAFRAQQRRWARGNAQMLRSLGLRVLRGDLQIGHRLGMLAHLFRRVVYMLLAILTITMPLTTFEWIHPLVNYSVSQDAIIFAAVVTSFLLVYVPAQRAARGSFWGAVFVVPLLLALNFGLSICCTAAFCSGLVSRDADFVRTPKTGGSKTLADGPTYRPPLDALCVVETLVGGAYLFFTWLAFSRHDVSISLFFLFVAISYLWVGLTSLLGWSESVSGALEARRKAGELTARLLAHATVPPPPAGREIVLDRLRAELARSRRHGGQVSLVLITDKGAISAVDRAGNASLGALLRSSLRPYDLVVSLSATQLAAVLPDTDAVTATQLVTRIEALAPGTGVRALKMGTAHGPLQDDDDAVRVFNRAENELRRACRPSAAPEAAVGAE